MRSPSGTGSSDWPNSCVITFFHKIIDLLKQKNIKKREMNKLTHELIMKQTD